MADGDVAGDETLNAPDGPEPP